MDGYVQLGIAIGLAAMLSATILSIMRPVHQGVAVASRVAILLTAATICDAVLGTPADPLALIVALAAVAAWFASLSVVRIHDPGAPTGSRIPPTISPPAPGRASLLTAICAAAIPLGIQLSGIGELAAAPGLTTAPGAGAYAALAAMAACLSCWSVVCACWMTPWRIHRSWTVPTMIATALIAAACLPATLSVSGTTDASVVADDGREYGYGPGGYGPLDAMPDVVSEPRSSRIGWSPVATADMLAMLAVAIMTARALTARYLRFDEDQPDDEGPAS